MTEGPARNAGGGNGREGRRQPATVAGLIGLVEGHTIAWTDPSGADRRLTPVMIEDPETPGGD